MVYFSAETIAVARELMARKLSPERARVSKVLLAAVEVLGLGSTPVPGEASEDTAP